MFAGRMEPIEAMIEALALEVAAIRKEGRSDRHQLLGGERIGRAEDAVLYRFPLTEELALRDETPVQVIVGAVAVAGTIVSIQDRIIIVALERDIGERIAVAALVIDDSFLVDRLRACLEEVRAGSRRFNRAAGDRVIGNGEPPVAVSEPPVGSVSLCADLNDEQRRAVMTSMGSDQVLVWGPPGTGKTTALARIVAAHYLAGKSVLLVSNTNAAVDAALKAIAKYLDNCKDQGFEEGKVLRFGPVVDKALEHDYGDRVIVDLVAERLGEELKVEQERLQQETATAINAVAQLVDAIADHERHRIAGEEVASAARQSAELEAKATALTKEVNALANQIARLRQDRARAASMGTIRRFLAGLDPERLGRELSAAEAHKINLERNAENGKSARASALSELNRLSTLAAMAQEKAKRHPPRDECERRLTTAKAHLTELRGQLAQVEARLRSLKDELLTKCRVLACTVYRTFLKGQVSRGFDVVVIDEASMVMLPMAYFAAGQATSTVVVAGDFRQLPAIVKCADPLAEEWLETDVFNKCGVPELVSQDRPPPQLVPLRVQYRMDKPIRAVVDGLFYGNRLRDGAVVESRGPWQWPLGSTSLLYVDTSTLRPWAANPVGKFTRYNILHALIVRNIVRQLSAAGFVAGSSGPNERLGVVTPYKAQTRLIGRLVAEQLNGLDLCATVHRFQGGERDAMIVDLPDSFGAWLGQFMKGVEPSDKGARLLNVALSRARRCVILVANFAFLRAKAPADGIVLRLLEEFERVGESIDPKRFAALDSQSWDQAVAAIRPAKLDLTDAAIGFFTEGTFYPAFQRDLQSAQRSIVIFSPYLTTRGAARWADVLRAALARGVRIRIVTRPPDNQPGLLEEQSTDAAGQLEALGIAVDLRAGFHEKLAIVDEETVWYGSLNILSHSDTTESMLRVPSRAASELIARYTSTNGGTAQNLDLAARENPPCSECGKATIWRTGRHGVWFACPDRQCGAKVDARRVSRSGRKRVDPPEDLKTVGGQCTRLGCGGTMRAKRGRFGSFLGCSEYPRCRQTEKLGGTLRATKEKRKR